MTTPPLISRAFPDFDVTTLPALPAGFVDISNKNDACPSFWHDEKQLKLWVDYAQPEDRENSEALRFSLVLTDAACEEPLIELFETESWDVMEEYLRTVCASRLTLMESLAKEARVMEGEEWDSDRVIAAGNEFFEVAKAYWPETFDDCSDFAVWCLKATSDEMVDEALHLIRTNQAR